MRRLALAHVLAVAPALALAACQPPSARNTRDRPVVTIHEGEDKDPVLKITEAEYRLELARARLAREGTLEAAPLSSKMKEALLARMIDRRLLLLAADRADITVPTSSVTKEIEEMKASISERELRERLIDTYQTQADLQQTVTERLRVARLLATEAHGGVGATEDEVRKAWDDIPPSERKLPRLVRASQIVVRTEEEGAAIVDELRKGRDFAEIARKKSLGPEAAQGGDLGWFEEGVMPKVFDEVCFSLKPGQTSALTPSEYGFHIFRVTASEPERELGYDDMKDRLKAGVLHRKLQDAEAVYVQRLRSKFRVVRNKEALAAID